MTKKPRKKLEPTLGERAMAATARGGLNTILLNVQQGLDAVRLDTAGLNASVSHIIEHHKEAKESRKEISEKLGMVCVGQASMSERVGSLEAKVEKIGEVVWKHEEIYQQQVGRKKFISQISGMLTTSRAAWTAALSSGGILAWLHWPWWHK